MITRKVAFSILSASLILSSCVSSKVYNDLETRYEDLRSENRQLTEDLGSLRKENERNARDLAELRQIHEQLVAERDQLQQEYNSTKSKYDNLVASYDALERNSSSALA